MKTVKDFKETLVINYEGEKKGTKKLDVTKMQFQKRNRKDYALAVLEEMVSDDFGEYIDGVVTHATFEYVLDITYADGKKENRNLETWTFDEKRFFETDEPLI